MKQPSMWGLSFLYGLVGGILWMRFGALLALAVFAVLVLITRVGLWLLARKPRE